MSTLGIRRVGICAVAALAIGCGEVVPVEDEGDLGVQHSEATYVGVLDGTDALAGRAFDDAILDDLAGLLPKQIQPMTSTFTPPGYRRRVSANLIKKLARDLFEAA